MKQFSVLSSVLCILLLSGCGEEGLSAGGASLGGSGGTSKPTRPGDHSAGSETEQYEVIVPPVSSDECNGLQRSMRVLNIETHQALAPHARHPLLPITTQDATNTIVQLQIRNTAAVPVYEYSPACAAPIQLLDSQQQVVLANQRLACDGANGIQVYRPYETRSYEFNFYLPSDVLTWFVNYNADYSLGELTEAPRHSACEPLKILLVVELIKPVEQHGKSSEGNTDQPDNQASNGNAKVTSGH